MRFVHHDLVPEQREVERGGQPRRTGADHRDPLPGRRKPLGDDLGRHLVEPVRQQDGIGDDAMHLAHVDRLVDRLPAAAALAGMLADTAGGGRQRVVHDDRFERVLQPPFLVQLQEARDVHVQRTTVLARRERQTLANAGAAALRADVVLEFVAEVAQRGQHGVGRGLAETAERGVADHPAQFVEFVQVLLTAFAFGDAREGAQRLVQSDPAGHAFAAGFGAGELDEVAGDVDHAVVFVHHHHAARTHDRAELPQRFEIDRGIEHLVRNAAAGRSAGLHRLDVMAERSAAAADVVDEVAERRAERHFDQAGVHHLADQGEDLGSGTGLAADLGEPRRAFGNDRRDVEPGLDVVDVGRMAPQALLGRDKEDAAASVPAVLPAN